MPGEPTHKPAYIQALILGLITLGAAFCKTGRAQALAQGEGRIATPHIITFFIERSRELPQAPDHTIIKKITGPGSRDRSFLKNQLRRRAITGIYATYMGWVATSDINGQILFPRKHAGTTITFIVTRSVQPVLISPTLVHHFVAGADEPVAYYSFELAQDPKTHIYQWHVRKTPTPADRVIPAAAIVLLAKPEQIIIHEGIFPSIKSPNLILPTIYATANLTAGINALHFLKVNRYFAPVVSSWRYGTARYGLTLMP
jgi:hypothetical protein